MAAGDKAYWSDVTNAVNPPSGRLVQQAAGVHAVANNAMVAMQFGAGSEEWDSPGFHDTVTNNSRVTPTVAGKYLVHGAVSLAGRSDYSSIEAVIAKNGTAVPPASTIAVGASNTTEVHNASALVSCNGTTDYFEVQARQVNVAAASVNTVVSAQFASVLEWVYIGP
jgi:hypothetical protein